MAQTQLSQRLGADTSIFDVDESVRLQMSRFDYSRKHNTTIDIGAFVPFDWFFCYPKDKISVNVRYLMDTLPLVNPPATNYRVLIHFDAIKISALWKGWNSFYTQGRKGQVAAKKVPFLSKDDFDGYSLPCSLSSYLGLPVREFSKKLGFRYFIPNYDSSASQLWEIEKLPYRNYPVNGVSALPFMAYQKIWRFSICKPNLLQDNEVWFPEDLSEEWRLNYLGTNMSKGFFSPQGTFKFDESGSPSVTPVANNVPSVDDNCVDIRQLRYATFPDDYFTSAKPWLVRGDVANGIDLLAISGTDGAFDFTDVFDQFLDASSVASGSTFNAYETLGVARISPSGQIGGNKPYLVNPTSGGGIGVYPAQGSAAIRKIFADAFNKLKFSKQVQFQGTLTANALRNMLAFSVWQERNALTNGNYNEFVKAHFGVNPSQPDYEPYYLGGTSDIVSFSQILQTSASQQDSPMGSNASLGSVNGQQHIFEFQFKDASIVMGTIFVVPEVYYDQGVGRDFTNQVAEDFFMPEFSKTGFEPVLNQEIFAQGTEDDLKLYGYQTRNAYLKARQNLVSGMFALPDTADRLFSSYVQAREFDSLPKLSMQFVSTSPENIRRDMLAYTNYPAFKLQIATDIKLIRALPYMSTPETFGF